MIINIWGTIANMELTFRKFRTAYPLSTEENCLMRTTSFDLEHPTV